MMIFLTIVYRLPQLLRLRKEVGVSISPSEIAYREGGHDAANDRATKTSLSFDKFSIIKPPGALSS